MPLSRPLRYAAKPMKTLPLSLIAVAIAAAMTGCATHPVAPVDINLVALNDFHGNLERSKFTYTSVADAERKTVQAGGIDTLSGALTAWRREDAQLIFVGNGDLVGASPAMSALWADEPSIVAMNMLGMKASSVGNHEFDQGKAELLRQQRGGCESSRADKACKFTPDFKGASYTYMAANVMTRNRQVAAARLPHRRGAWRQGGPDRRRAERYAVRGDGGRHCRPAVWR